MAAEPARKAGAGVEHDQYADEAHDHRAPSLPSRPLAEQQRGEQNREDRHRQVDRRRLGHRQQDRSEEHTSELQSLMRISYAVFCLQKKKKDTLSTKDK